MKFTLPGQRHVEQLAQEAIAERLGHPADDAVISVTADPDQAEAVILHVNSGGNALACTALFNRIGYQHVALPAEPGQYGVRLRVLTGPTTPLQPHGEETAA
ncbi:hypothetical protein [Streptomyces sp. bgisy153]|uniref:hypothetical protein n=1 Tax=Streptomyces sp. bgisy153 TaxID=3413793 RepID=UPI003D75FAC5